MDERGQRDGRPSPTRDGEEWPPGDRAEPGMRSAAPSLVQLGRAGRPPSILAAACVLFVAIAILKPWPDGARPPAPIEQRPALGTPATPPPTADPLAELRSHCEQPLGWRVYSIERWADQTLRIWRSLQPAPSADDASDARIPVIPLGPAVELAGYCSPWDGQERPPAGSTLLAWSIRTGGAGHPTPIELNLVAPHPPSVLGALLGPPGTSTSQTAKPSRPAPAAGSPAQPSPGTVPNPSATSPRGTAIWPSGRFVFELVGPAWQRWWAVDVPPPAATPAG